MMKSIVLIEVPSCSWTTARARVRTSCHAKGPAVVLRQAAPADLHHVVVPGDLECFVEPLPVPSILVQDGAPSACERSSSSLLPNGVTQLYPWYAVMIVRRMGATEKLLHAPNKHAVDVFETGQVTLFEIQTTEHKA